MFGRCPGSGDADVAMSVSLCPRRSSRAGRMVNLLQIDHRGEGVELFEHVIRAPLRRERGDRPARIRRVTEGDRATRTRLRTGARELVGLEIAKLCGRE